LPEAAANRFHLFSIHFIDHFLLFQ
jgi:hypothetical protein